MTDTGLIGEYGYVDTDNEHAYALSSNSRAFLAQNFRAKNWAEAAYVRLDMRGRTMSFTVDVSKVPCGVIMTLYLVNMGDPNGASNYCDIQPKQGGCTEIDIMEANAYAYQATVHTVLGEKFDGSCNEKGCWSNIGKYPYAFGGSKSKDLYGPGGLIDTKKPYKVTASFSQDGEMTVVLHQGLKFLPVYNRSLPGNTPDVKKADWFNLAAYPRPAGVPLAAKAKIVDMFESNGGVMVTSLWTANGTEWLDGGSCINKTRGKIKGVIATVSDFLITGPPPPSTSTHTTSTVTTTTFTIPKHQGPPPPPPGLAARIKKAPHVAAFTPAPLKFKKPQASTTHKAPPPPINLYIAPQATPVLPNGSISSITVAMAVLGMAIVMTTGAIAVKPLVRACTLRGSRELPLSNTQEGLMPQAEMLEVE